MLGSLTGTDRREDKAILWKPKSVERCYSTLDEKAKVNGHASSLNTLFPSPRKEKVGIYLSQIPLEDTCRFQLTEESRIRSRISSSWLLSGDILQHRGHVRDSDSRSCPALMKKSLSWQHIKQLRAAPAGSAHFQTGMKAPSMCQLQILEQW